MAVSSDPPLAEQDRTRGREPDGDRDRDQEWCHGEHRQPGGDAVERVFDGEFPSARIGRMHRNHRKPPNEMDGRPQVDRFIQAGHHDDRNSEVVAVGKFAHDLSIRRRGERQYELTCSRPPDRLPKIVQRAKQRECSPGAKLVGRRIGVDVPDRLQPG